MSEDKRDIGWEYLHSKDEEGSFSEDDGSWGYTNSDGSGSYHGADGSWGYKNADGSASFHGADGSWGYRNADGSSSYHGSDGTWGYKNSDGSGSYHSGSGESSYFDADADDDSDNDYYSSDSSGSDSGDLADALAGLLTVAVGAGIAAHSRKKQQEREEEAQRQAEAERIRLEKEQERKARNTLKKKRVKAFFFKGKKIEVSHDCEYLIGRNMSFVADSFAEDAFSNVQTIPIKDIYKGSAHKVGQVDQVVINGSSFFRKGDLIPYDAEIIITYHEKKEITIPFSERSLRKMNYVAAGDRFQELGFTEIYEKPICDLVTGWIKKDGMVEKITIGNVYPFKKNSVFPYDVKITIEYHTFKKK